MELIDIKRVSGNNAEIAIKIGGTVKRYGFSYTEGEIFVADFPEELRRLLRLLPVTVAQSIVSKVENCLTSNVPGFPFEFEIEKEILQLV